MINEEHMRPMVTDEELKRAIDVGAQFFTDFDLDFYRRVWATDLNVYRKRLEAIQFSGMEHVLDAGCGNGQWALCLSERNSYVYGIDVLPARLEATKAIMKELGVQNVEVGQQALEELTFPDETFDAIFCYGVLLFTDFRRSLSQFYRVLKPKGKIYVCTNGIGWYVSNLISPHNPSRNYDPRQVAVQAITNTVAFFAEGKERFEGQMAVPSRVVKKYLESIGFENVIVGGEGTLRLEENISIKSFFKTKYNGLEGVYELLAWKSCRNP